MTETAKVGIGSPVWIFNSNRRVYREGARGGPIWREHWMPEKIVGETSRSWIVGQGTWEKKIPKKGPWHGVAFSQEEIDNAAYVHEHRFRISEKVGRLDDFACLRKIAELIGYEERK